MKNRWTKNLGLKFLSLIAAVAIWLVIVSAYDPAVTADFTLNVEILNGDAITSLNKVYEVIEGDTVTIRVKGNKTQVNSLRTSDFKAVADISKLSPTNHASISVVCTKTNNVEISFLGKVNMLAIRLEDVAQKQFKVTVVQEGTAETGYYIGASTAKPNLIQVSGAESTIERISEIRVAVDVSEAIGNFRIEAEPRAYDENGKEIKTGSLTFSKNPVVVTTTVYGTKEIPIEVLAEGEAYSGYRLVDTEYEPKSVIVAGTAETLESITVLRIPISIANRITSLEDTLTLADYMPQNVYLNDMTATVNVLLEIEKLENSIYELDYDMIQLRGMNQQQWNYQVEQTGSFSVGVMGIREELNELHQTELRPYVDLSEVSEAGTYTLNIQFELPDRFTIREVSGSMLAITVYVTSKQEPPQESGEPEEDSKPEEDEPPGENETETPIEGETSTEEEDSASSEEDGTTEGNPAPEETVEQEDNDRQGQNVASEEKHTLTGEEEAAESSNPDLEDGQESQQGEEEGGEPEEDETMDQLG